jgi:hypothetical protein
VRGVPVELLIMAGFVNTALFVLAAALALLAAACRRSETKGLRRIAAWSSSTAAGLTLVLVVAVLATGIVWLLTLLR